MLKDEKHPHTRTGTLKQKIQIKESSKPPALLSYYLITILCLFILPSFLIS